MSLMLTKAAFIDQKYCKNSNIVKTYFNYNAFCYNIFSNVIYSFDDQAEFSRFKVQGFFICHIINYTGYN